MKRSLLLVSLALTLAPCLMAQTQTFEGLSRAGVESAIRYYENGTLHDLYLSYAGSIFSWDGAESKFLGHLGGDYRWITHPSGSPYLAASSWQNTVLIDTRPAGKVLRLLPPNSSLVGKPQTVVGAEVNKRGTLAIVRLGWSDTHESWSKPYLMSVPAMQVLSELQDFGEYWFAEDGTRLVWERDEWDPVTGEKIGTKMTYVSSRGEELKGAVRDVDQSPGLSRMIEVKDMSSSEARRKEALPDFVWNEFGLRALSPRWESGNLRYTFVEWVSGKPGGPEPWYYWETARRPVQTLQSLGLDLNSDKGVTTLIRKSPDGKVVWSKKFLGYGVVKGWRASAELNQGWLLLNRPKVSASGTDIEGTQALRLINWTTGLPIGRDRPVPFPGIDGLNEIEPSEGWVSLSSSRLSTLYWPDLDRWANPDGTWVVTKGVSDRVTTGPDRGVTRTEGSKVTVLPPAPGQIGSIVRLARSPDGAWFLAIDEAGRLFARRSADGAVLASAPQNEVDQAFFSGISAALQSPLVPYSPPRPWYSITDVTITVAPTFRAPAGNK